jgi:histidine triad (HIT) family protein
VDPNCIFCKIVAGEIPSTAVYQEEKTYAFADLEPQAPNHFLVVPREHLVDITELADHPDLAAAVVAAVSNVATQEGLEHFRTVLNTGAESGQSVFHVHAHVLSGRRMTWPPG